MTKDQKHLITAAALVTMTGLAKDDAQRPLLRDALVSFTLFDNVAELNSTLTERNRAANEWRTNCLNWRGF